MPSVPHPRVLAVALLLLAAGLLALMVVRDGNDWWLVLLSSVCAVSAVLLATVKRS